MMFSMSTVHEFEFNSPASKTNKFRLYHKPFPGMFVTNTQRDQNRYGQDQIIKKCS